MTILKTVTTHEFLLVGDFLSLWVNHCHKFGDNDLDRWRPEGSITGFILESLCNLVDSYKERSWVISLDGEL